MKVQERDLARKSNSGKIITVAMIIGKPVLEIAYSRLLKEIGFAGGYEGSELEKRYS